MSRIETTTRELYKFDELSDGAKEKAREWWRRCEDEEGLDTEYIFDDAADIADLFGLAIRQTRKGTGTYYPTIYYSGFSSQGDGACFEGSYQYKKGALKAVKAYAPKDAELHRIVKELQDAQRRNFYQLRATTKHSGHYYHSGCMSVDVERYDGNEVSDDTEETIKQALRDFADWIYGTLEKEYEYRMSDEQVDDAITANAYEFTINGSRV